MNTLEVIQKIIETTKTNVRFYVYFESGSELSEWQSGFIFPVKGYFEPVKIGPIKINQWEWLEIDPIENIEIGRLVPDKKVNHFSEIIELLRRENISYVENNGIIKIQNLNYIPKT